MKNALRESGAPKNIFNGQGALRDVSRMFEQADVTRHERGRRETEYLPERKIPRHDGEDRSDRLIANIAARGVGLDRLIGEVTFCALGVKPTALRAFDDLVTGPAQQLAHFERDDSGERFLLALEEIRGGEQAASALLE